MSKHVHKNLTTVLAITGLLLVALVSSSCAARAASQPALAAASRPQSIPTEQVFRFGPLIPLVDGHMYDGSVYVTQEEAEAALGKQIRLPAASRLPANVTITHFELLPTLREVAVHYSDGIVITVSNAPGAEEGEQFIRDWSLGQSSPGLKGIVKLIEIKGTPALGSEPGVIQTPLGYQAINGNLRWNEGDTVYNISTSTWPLEQLIALAETMIGPPEE
jgi:hypothetical protein